MTCNEQRGTNNEERTTILAPTTLEYWAVRMLLPHATICKTGIGLARCDPLCPGLATCIVCGLAGSLIPSLEPGTVLVPDLVGTPDGTIVRCDAEIREALIRGARGIGYNPEQGPMLTASSLVTGAAREEWAARGFVAADMEAGLLAGTVERFAAVRVVLDTPGRSISDRWLSPSQAMRSPALWPELIWLAEAAPRYALRAARTLKAGLEEWARTPND